MIIFELACSFLMFSFAVGAVYFCNFHSDLFVFLCSWHHTFYSPCTAFHHAMVLLLICLLFMMDTNPVSTPAMSAPADDSAAPGLGDPADTTQGNSTVAVAGLDLDAYSVVQESVVLESGEGGDGGDGDGSGTPGLGGTSMDSDETTTTTTTSSEKSSSDNDEQEQDTSREQQLNKADLECLVDMGAPGGAVATVAIKATQ